MHVQRAGPPSAVDPRQQRGGGFLLRPVPSRSQRVVQCGPATFLKRLEIGVVWNFQSNELREVAWLTSMVGVLSILSVGVGAGLALMFVGVT